MCIIIALIFRFVITQLRWRACICYYLYGSRCSRWQTILFFVLGVLCMFLGKDATFISQSRNDNYSLAKARVEAHKNNHYSDLQSIWVMWCVRDGDLLKCILHTNYTFIILVFKTHFCCLQVFDTSFFGNEIG